MELAPSDLEDGIIEEFQKTRSKECLQRLLDSQRDLFRCQVDQLQRIVAHQCKVTGANPLSQEMAAGALSINIGKKPRDLLNPKAMNYMQSVFALKDSISKKESREISALCGVTVTQVREYFSSQRTRVRKLVRLSREKAIKSSENNEISANHPLPLDSDPTAVSGSSLDHDSSTEETLLGLDTDDKNFLDQIFGLMHKEKTFSGQMKLIEWILQINTSAVLLWFLTNGGVSILATWLNEATFEEQTSVILAIFKVLCHLPLHKALPAQMSAILQTVNKLRFYRTSDISSKARVLLSRWSKLFIRSQVLNRPPVKYPLESQKEIIRRQRISEILSDGSWLSKVGLPDDILALGDETSDGARKSNPKQVTRLHPPNPNESTKKHALSSSCSKTKQKRKVLLVEQPDSRNSRGSVQVARTLPAKGSRPMSSDDIQKAKMHAIFMQRKYGTQDASSNPSDDNKISKLPESEADKEDKPLPESNPMFYSNSAIPVESKPITSTRLVNSRSKSTSQSLPEKLRMDRAMWRTPPAIQISEDWRVGGGENSKEVEVQAARIRREPAAVYGPHSRPPPNPKEPWDREMDFDDSLTPEIPTNPPPDSEAPASSPPAAPPAAPEEPDLELLAALLKNPELVFALTSGQGSGLSNAETVALLDVIKQSTGAATSAPSTSGLPPVSLPSPTPSSEREKSAVERLPEPPHYQFHHQPPHRRHHHHHHHHHQQYNSHPMFSRDTSAEPPLYSRPEQAQSPIPGRWVNGRLDGPIPPRAPGLENWSPQRSRVPPHMPGRFWPDRNLR